MKKDTVVENTIENILGRETIYELRSVRDRVKSGDIPINQAQVEITASKHIIQVMALDLKAKELNNTNILSERDVVKLCNK